MNLIRFIGDCHGKFSEYRKLTETCDQSIQVGDFGIIGFGYPPKVSDKHKYIRGNHDNPGLCKLDPHWIPDGTISMYVNSVYENPIKMFFCGGAHSIDKKYRIEGLSWWPDEEIPYYKWVEEIIPKYEEFKPDILVTHECPESISNMLFRRCPEAVPVTRKALDEMLSIHKPKIHIFGHWHTSIDRVIEGTRYRCLSELEWADLDLDTLEFVNKGFG